MEAEGPHRSIFPMADREWPLPSLQKKHSNSHFWTSWELTLKTRAIRDLAQFSDPELFSEKSADLGQIPSSVVRLDQDARVIEENKYLRGAKTDTTGR